MTEPRKRRSRRAFVTGGAQGIGLAVVQRLAAEGCAVVFADRDAQAAEHAAAETGATACVLDVTDAESLRATIDAHGPFGVLVNNAGLDQHGYFTASVPADWRAILDVNLEAVLVATQAALPGMRAAGYGRIVNVASEAGRLGSRGGAVYAAAKGGVIAFTRSLARECADYGVTANAVAPGPIDTPLLRAAVAAGGDKLMRAMTDATLLKRLGDPDEVAAAVAFLASDAAGYITGEVLGVSGGMGCGA